MIQLTQTTDRHECRTMEARQVSTRCTAPLVCTHLWNNERPVGTRGPQVILPLREVARHLLPHQGLAVYLVAP